MLDYAVCGYAGALAESKRCRLAGFPDNSERHARGDRKNIDNAAKRAGWDRHADDFRALARDLARIALDYEPVWRAVIGPATALHARYWPLALDERWPGADEAGEHVGTMPGDEAERILRKAAYIRAACAGAISRRRSSTDMLVALDDRNTRDAKGGVLLIGGKTGIEGRL
jgi:hypothetical protein